MGGSASSTQKINQTSKTTPYGPTTEPINSLVGNLGNINPSLTGAETGALDSLQTNANAGNPYAGQIGGVANSLLSGGTDRSGVVNDAYSSYQNYLNPIANSSPDPTQNPELMRYLGVAGDDAAGRINGMFAGAGRDFSGAHAQALGRGVTAATAPILYDAYNQGANRRDNAASNLYGAGGTTASLLSGLDQTKLGNQQAGIDASSSAMQANDSPFMQTIAIEAQRRGIPMETMKGLLGQLGQIGQAFGTNNTNGTTTTETQTPLLQQIAGGLIGGTGLLGQLGGFGKSGWLYGGPSAVLGGK